MLFTPGYLVNKVTLIRDRHTELLQIGQRQIRHTYRVILQTYLHETLALTIAESAIVVIVHTLKKLKSKNNLH